MKPHWRNDALCREVDPEIMFPRKGEPTKPGKSVCARCDVRAECLDDALANDERFGIWGGLSERERQRLRRGERLAPVVALPTPSVTEQPRRAA